MKRFANFLIVNFSLTWVLPIIVFCCTVSFVTFANAASFNCSKASTLNEKAICADPELSKLDEVLAATYKEVRSAIANKEMLKSEQINWIKSISTCNGITECLVEAYKNRIRILEFADGDFEIRIEPSIEKIAELEDWEKLLNLKAQALVEKANALEAQALNIEESSRKLDTLINVNTALKNELEKEEARLQKLIKEDSDRKKLAGEQKRLLIAEQKKDLLLSKTPSAPADIIMIVNKSSDAPNLVRSMSGEIVSATGEAKICTVLDTGDRTSEAAERYQSFYLKQLDKTPLKDTRKIFVKLENCSNIKSFDFLIYQKRALKELSPFNNLFNIMASFKDANFESIVVLTDESARANERSFIEALANARDQLKKYSLEIEGKLLSKSIQGAGVIVIPGNAKTFCYAQDDQLGGSLFSTIPELMLPVLKDLSEAFLNEGLSYKDFTINKSKNLDDIYFGIIRGEQSCKMIFASNKNLNLLTSALKRESIEYSTAPYWIYPDDLNDKLKIGTNLKAQADIEQAKQDRIKKEEEKREAGLRKVREEKEAELRKLRDAQNLLNENLSNAEWLVNEYNATTKGSYPCQKSVERILRGEFEWTDGWLGTKFPTFFTKTRSPGVVVILGDKLLATNGFGAKLKVKYYCQYDVVNDKVIDVWID